MDEKGSGLLYGSYEEFKGLLGTELRQEAESFVRIGYLLKVARDTDILEGSGYRTVAEFAAAEYGLTKDIVSRYMAINDKYSEGGYSEVLQEKYRQYGYSKLAEMLTLPAAIADEIPPEATRADIQEIKKEVRDERQVSPMELMTEDRRDEQQPLIYRMLREYYHGKAAEYEAVHEAITLRKPYDDMEYYVSTAKDLLAPSGNVIMMSRVSGIGRLMLIVRDGQRPDLLNVRTNEKTPCGWEEIVQALISLCPHETLENSWELIYGEPYPMAAALRAERSEKDEKAVKVSKTPDKKPARTKKKAEISGRRDKKSETAAHQEPAEAAGEEVSKGNSLPDEAGNYEQNEQIEPENYPQARQRENDMKIINAKHLARVTMSAIDSGKFASARRAARHLIEVLAEICEAQEAMDIDGQMNMDDLIGDKEKEAV